MKKVFFISAILVVLVAAFSFYFINSYEGIERGTEANPEIEKCVSDLMKEDEGKNVDNEVLIVLFKEKISDEEVSMIAEENNLGVRLIYKSFPGAVFEVVDGADVYERACILMKDSRVESAGADGIVGAN